MRLTWTSFAAVALLACSCGGQSAAGDAADASLDAAAGADAPPGLDAEKETGAIFDSGGDRDADADAGAPDCTYGDGGSVFDGGGRFSGSCAGGCPAGTVCAVEIGGVAGGGGEYCAPILDRCKNDVSCACLASCLCGSSFGRAERCNDETLDGGEVLACDNGIR